MWFLEGSGVCGGVNDKGRREREREGIRGFEKEKEKEKERAKEKERGKKQMKRRAKEAGPTRDGETMDMKAREAGACHVRVICRELLLFLLTSFPEASLSFFLPLLFILLLFL